LLLIAYERRHLRLIDKPSETSEEARSIPREDERVLSFLVVVHSAVRPQRSDPVEQTDRETDTERRERGNKRSELSLI